MALVGMDRVSGGIRKGSAWLSSHYLRGPLSMDGGVGISVPGGDFGVVAVRKGIIISSRWSVLMRSTLLGRLLGSCNFFGLLSFLCLSSLFGFGLKRLLLGSRDLLERSLWGLWRDLGRGLLWGLLRGSLGLWGWFRWSLLLWGWFRGSLLLDWFRGSLLCGRFRGSLLWGWFRGSLWGCLGGGVLLGLL